MTHPQPPPPPSHARNPSPRYLPLAAQEYFLVVVNAFVYRPCEKADDIKEKHKQKLLKISNQLSQHQDPDHDEFGGFGLSQGPAVGASQLSQDAKHAAEAMHLVQASEKTDEEDMNKYLARLVSGSLTEKMLNMVGELDMYDHNR